jgi:hypothetical protein
MDHFRTTRLLRPEIFAASRLGHNFASNGRLNFKRSFQTRLEAFVTARIFPKFRPRRRALTRKLALEFWIVGIASAILLAIAVGLQGAGSSAAEDLGAATEAGRPARLTNSEVKDFLVRAALASAASVRAAAASVDSSASGGLATPTGVPALSRAAVAPRAAQQKAQAPARETAALDDGPWRLVEDTSASAKNSLTTFAKKLPL